MASDLKFGKKAPLTYKTWLAYIGQHDLHRFGSKLPKCFPQGLVGRSFAVRSYLYSGLAQGRIKGN